jgi:hypothetical protein
VFMRLKFFKQIIDISFSPCSLKMIPKQNIT